MGFEFTYPAGLGNRKDADKPMVWVSLPSLDAVFPPRVYGEPIFPLPSMELAVFLPNGIGRTNL
jgi:hypothetical protein